MRVTFTKTGERRYSVTVDGAGIDRATMDPAPGFDPRLPHDAAHFIAENELGIAGGLFGQLASGGTANTFFSDESKKARKVKRRGRALAKSNKEDAAFSEHAVYAAQSRWERREVVPPTNIPEADLLRIIERFEDFASQWSRISVGESITMEWQQPSRSKRGR